jgi:hypothetical protein
MDFSSLQLGRAFGILRRTMPILLVRLGVYMIFWVVSVVYVALFWGLAWLMSKIHPFLAVIVVIVAFGGAIPLFRVAKQYLLYMIQAAHLAVVAELLAGREIPDGKSQLEWGKEKVTERFGQVSVLFVVDNLVRAIVGRFTAVVARLFRFIPGNAGRNLAQVINRIIRFATDYIDEAILARAFWKREESMWVAAKEGVILYGMVWKPLLMNAVALMLLSYVPAVAVLLLVALPMGLLVSMISSTLAAWTVLILLVLAWLVKLAVGDAYAMICMVAAYQKATDGLVPDPAVEAKLDQVSDKFKELKARAMGEQGPTGDAEVAAPAAG